MGAARAAGIPSLTFDAPAGRDRRGVPGTQTADLSAPGPGDPPAAPPRLLDSLRGLAALIVVFTHLLSLGPPLALPDWLGWTPLRAVQTGRAPVVFFFVLSGYVLALSLLRDDRTGLAQFALRRTVRLMVPVAGAVLLSAALCTLAWRGPVPGAGPDLGHLWSEPLGAAMVLRQALLLGGDGSYTLDIPLWTLVHEWRLTVLFPLVLVFRRRPLLLVGLALAAQAAAIALGVAPDRHQLGPRLLSTVLSGGSRSMRSTSAAKSSRRSPKRCGAAKGMER